jgi:hypothetical protein
MFWEMRFSQRIYIWLTSARTMDDQRMSRQIDQTTIAHKRSASGIATANPTKKSDPTRYR